MHRGRREERERRSKVNLCHADERHLNRSAYTSTWHKFHLLTYSSDFGAARLDSCELRTVVPYTYRLSERSAELYGRRSGGR
ncbi:hypothetical protein EVAR_63207_1 [Eumeta japonica]|uniref:Uncharacterized protein n=1 Tax=Eumeta variegata TaxID=151549 RepID=A0A4C1ZLJ7_EUMVA|nr:hypothetical protein EVAR_63207_1 [Eumeta japonica]